MPFGWRKRKRFERVASLELPPGQWERAWTSLRRRDVLGRIGLALLAAVDHVRGDPRLGPAVLLSHRLHAAARHRGRRAPSPRPTPWPPRPPSSGPAARHATSTCRTPSRWCSCGPKLRNTLVELTAAPTLDKLDPKIWDEFQPPPAEGAKPPDGQAAGGAVPRVPRRRSRPRNAGSRREGPGRGLRPLRGARPAGQTRSGQARPGQPGGDHRLSGGPSRSRSRSSASATC